MIGLYMLGGAFLALGFFFLIFGNVIGVFFGIGFLLIGVVSFIGASLIGGQRQHYGGHSRRGRYDYDDEPRRLPRGKSKRRITYEVIESSDEHEAQVEVRDVPKQLPVIKRKPIHMRKR